MDFHIAYYLGQLANADPTGFYHIISRDKGFDPLLKHLKSKGIFALRSASIEEMPCFKSPGEAPPKPLDPRPNPKPPATSKATAPAAADPVVKAVVADLIARKTSKPKTTKTLLNTVHSKVGKATPIKEIEKIYATLCKKGYVKENGKNVSYSLPQPTQGV